MKLLHLSLFLCLLAPTASWALTDDTKQPVYIDSDQQHIDMKTNKVTFSGNVKLKQGSIRVTADELIVFRDEKTGELSKLEGYGKPAHFTQQTDDGKTLQGQAETLVYSVVKDTLVMTTNAELHQDDSVIRGKVITYHITSQNLQADGGNNGERVSTVIQPSQLESK